MKKVFLVLLIFGLCCLTAFGQASGNRTYNQDTRNAGRRAAPTSGTVYNNDGNVVIEAYVLLNATADEYVAVFGAAQEGQTAVESNQKVNALIEQFLSGAEKLGVKRGETFVDFITQNRVYNFTRDSDGTIREVLTGFETKKTIALRFKDYSLLEKLLTVAAQASIFDLIKVDYVVNDMNKIRSRLFDEAVSVVKQKEDTYTRSLGMVMKRDALLQATYDTHFPWELYQTYTAFESGAVDNYYSSNAPRIIRERKSSTSYLEPLDRSVFDSVINPVGIEPKVQCTLYMKVLYSLAR